MNLSEYAAYSAQRELLATNQARERLRLQARTLRDYHAALALPFTFLDREAFVRRAKRQLDSIRK